MEEKDVKGELSEEEKKEFVDKQNEEKLVQIKLFDD
jgi:hypothetical protein